jgi:hypothetical protein
MPFGRVCGGAVNSIAHSWLLMLSTRPRDSYVEQYGLHHWWLDCNEPCGGTNNGSFANDWVYNNGTWPAAFVGAAYPHMVNQMIYEGEGAPGKVRLILPTRLAHRTDSHRSLPPHTICRAGICSRQRDAGEGIVGRVAAIWCGSLVW